MEFFVLGKKKHLNLNVAQYSLDVISARLKFIESGIRKLGETQRQLFMFIQIF